MMLPVRWYSVRSFSPSADRAAPSQTMWDEHKMLFKALVDAESAKGESAEPAAEGGSDA
jgi:hypothetical protein